MHPRGSKGLWRMNVRPYPPTSTSPYLPALRNPPSFTLPQSPILHLPHHPFIHPNLNLIINLTAPRPAAGDYVPRPTDSGMNNTSAGGGEGTGRDYNHDTTNQNSDYKTGNYPPEGDCTCSLPVSCFLFRFSSESQTPHSNIRLISIIPTSKTIALNDTHTI